MTTTLRIDKLDENADGTFEVSYTRGEAPLPNEPSGRSIQFSTRADFVSAISEAEESLTDVQLISIAVANWFQADTSMQNLSTASNRSVSIDLSGAIKSIALS